MHFVTLVQVRVCLVSLIASEVASSWPYTFADNYSILQKSYENTSHFQTSPNFFKWYNISWNDMIYISTEANESGLSWFLCKWPSKSSVRLPALHRLDHVSGYYYKLPLVASIWLNQVQDVSLPVYCLDCNDLCCLADVSSISWFKASEEHTFNFLCPIAGADLVLDTSLFSDVISSAKLWAYEWKLKTRLFCKLLP